MEISLSNLELIAGALRTELRLNKAYLNRSQEQDVHIIQVEYLLRNIETLIERQGGDRDETRR